MSDPPASSVASGEPAGAFGIVHFFFWSVAEPEALGPAAIAAAEYDGVFWISYPKKSSRVATDLTRDQGWDVLKWTGLRPVTQISIDQVWDVLEWTGLRPVTQISIDQVWSALRFRPAERVES